ncbi:hypothetical protein PENTCL1PPCAC_6105, partial [Pristionchus entomophagus]
YSEWERNRYEQSLARFDIPFCLISFIPVIFLLNVYRKDEEAWKRDKSLLAPTFVVLGITSILGLYTEIHLSYINWLDIGVSGNDCNLTFNGLVTLAMTPYLFMPV